jgi:hypothetical protein
MRRLSRSNRFALLTILYCTAFGSAATRLGAAVILPNLPPGAKYELLFVTQDKTLATSANIATYNTFASTEESLNPALAALEATWHAVVSTATTNALVNAPDVGIAVYDTQGHLLATAATGIYSRGSLLAAPQYNQFGDLDVTCAWTGTGILGHAFPLHAMGETSPIWGSTSDVNTGWITHAAGLYSSMAIYALSSPITVPKPTPEPSTLTLAALGFAALAAWRWRRQEARN